MGKCSDVAAARPGTKGGEPMSIPEIRVYVLLCLMTLTIAFTIPMDGLFKLGFVLIGLLAVKHLATELES
jgi:hypothetical protein